MSATVEMTRQGPWREGEPPEWRAKIEAGECVVDKCDCKGTKVEPCGCNHITRTLCERHERFVKAYADAWQKIWTAAELERRKPC